MPAGSPATRPWWLFAAAAVFLLVVAVLLIGSFSRPAVLEFEPGAGGGRPADGTFVEDTVTLDARDGSSWTFFDLERGRVVDGRVDPDWDLAVQRFHIVTNGGPGYPGDGGALALDAPWEAVAEAPETGYRETAGRLEAGPVNPALERWYEYSFFAHTLMPSSATYIVRTAEGRYAKFRILSYYCPGAVPGCLTLRYAVQGDGSRRLTPTPR